MKSFFIRIGFAIAVAGMFMFLQSNKISAQSLASSVKNGAVDNNDQRDGSHDYDWMAGTWKATLKRLDAPLTGSTKWIEYNDATQITKKVFEGRASLDEFTAHKRDTKEKIEGITLRLYNPDKREWCVYWATLKVGTITLPPSCGRYNSEGVQLYSDEEYKERMIKVRQRWYDITPDSAKFEQSFSIDGGKTWEPNWISEITRVKE